MFLAALEGAFDLDALEVALVVDYEVVGGAVSAGLGEDQAQFGGAELETEFGPLSAALGVSDVLALVGALVLHELSWVFLAIKNAARRPRWFGHYLYNHYII
jgi:hypothetical protein